MRLKPLQLHTEKLTIIRIVVRCVCWLPVCRELLCCTAALHCQLLHSSRQLSCAYRPANHSVFAQAGSMHVQQNAS